jgi:predicted phage terminase large subunit-like protein
VTISIKPQRSVISLPSSYMNETIDGYSFDWTPYPHQIPPDGDWRLWMMLGGRGSGKTEAGARYVLDHLRRYGRKARVGVGAPTIQSAREVCAEGESGLITIARNEFEWNRSLMEARHKDGGYVKFQGAEEPARWNGPQWTLLWADELALWKRESYDQATFGVRLGATPRIIATTTPKAARWVKALEEDPRTVITHGTIYDNPALAQSAVDALVRRYGGTRLGRQELLGEYIEEIDGALWRMEWIDGQRRSEVPTTAMIIEDEDGEHETNVVDLPRIVIAIDPAVTANVNSDETAIAVAGLGHDGDYYVMSIMGYRLPPQQWAMKAIEMYDTWQADKIVAEVNNGGDMVIDTIKRTCEGLGRSAINVEAIRASRGKTLRAEPIAALYEQGRVHHVGIFIEAEDQMCSFPIANEHDDLVDAVVYALSDLSHQGAPNIRFLDM